MSKNFATSTVATAPSPAASGTSLVVAAGTGSRFFVGLASVYPAGATPTPANAEVVSITAISTDTLTITRAQESSSARTVVVGDVIQQGVTGGMWDGLSATFAPLASPTFTGNPTAPTASPGDNDTSVATTAFVTAAVAVETSRATTAEGLATPKPSAPTAQSANYTMVATDSLVLMTTGSTTKTVTLPATAAAVPGRAYGAKKVDSGIGALVLAPASGTIDGAASVSTSTQNVAFTAYSDGTNWWLA